MAAVENIASICGTWALASARMVRRMLAPLHWHRIGVLVDYGPGTGRFTFEAVKRMRSDAVLLAIETGEDFEALRRNCDDRRLTIVQGTAQDVSRHLSEQNLGGADCILTGLPFSTLGQKEAEAIMSESARVMSSSGVLAACQIRSAIRPPLERHHEWRE